MRGPRPIITALSASNGPLSTALAESSSLVEFGWLTFVACCVKAPRELSWRKAFAVAGGPAAQIDH
ncbi:MAG TPA: hypothetical protein DCP11_14410 [Microbacteriaceae bacterium]|nr:hypothetical protein [Microbacteriaceae bacterium]